jgi:membrane protein
MRLYRFAEKNGPHVEAVKERTSPWKLGGLTPLQLVKRVYHEIDEDEVLTRSAALAYYFVSALFPMIFFLMAMLGLFAQSHNLQSSLLNYTARFMPGDAYMLVQKTLQELTNSSTGFKLAFGLVLALWSGAGGVVSIMDALNRCYHVKDTRPFWKQRLIALGLTVAIAALTIMALTLLAHTSD